MFPFAMDRRPGRGTYRPLNVSVHLTCDSQRKKCELCVLTGIILSAILLIVFAQKKKGPNDAAVKLPTLVKVNESALGATPSLHPMPLYIGAGQGTTGTNSMHSALCHLGIPSVHFNQACFRRNNTEMNLEGSLLAGVKAHFQVKKVWRALSGCTKDSQCSFKEGTQLAANLREHVAEVVRSGLLALHDTPYTKMLSYVLETSKNEGRSTIILLSERDPNEWAVRRAEDHQHDIICRNTTANFDINSCINLVDASEPPPSKFGEYFFSYDSNDDVKHQEYFKECLKSGMESYQDFVRQIPPDYMINFWKKPMDTSNLASKIWSSTAANLPPEAVAVLGDSKGNALKSEPHPKWDIQKV